MSRTTRIPAVRTVLELVNTAVDKTGARQITLANTNDPETISLIEHMADKAEQGHVTGVRRASPVRPQGGDRLLNDNEINCIEALISYQAEELKRTPYAIDKAVCSFFGVDTLRELKAWEYDGVMQYLVHLPRNVS